MAVRSINETETVPASISLWNRLLTDRALFPPPQRHAVRARREYAQGRPNLLLGVLHRNLGCRSRRARFDRLVGDAFVSVFGDTGRQRRPVRVRSRLYVQSNPAVVSLPVQLEFDPHVLVFGIPAANIEMGEIRAPISLAILVGSAGCTQLYKAGVPEILGRGADLGILRERLRIWVPAAPHHHSIVVLVDGVHQ
jgi:hypothetical protein